MVRQGKEQQQRMVRGRQQEELLLCDLADFAVVPVQEVTLSVRF